MPANPAAFDFLAKRMSHPAKAMAGPAPTRDELNAILTAALRVPDHGKLEPWRLVVLEKPALDRLAALAVERAAELGGNPEMVEKGRGIYDRAQLGVAVIASPKPSDKIPAIEQTLSAGALCFGIVNAATAAGWGANWLTGWTAHDPVFAARAFGCQPGEWVAGVIYLGTPISPIPDRPRPDLSKIVTWVDK